MRLSALKLAVLLCAIGAGAAGAQPAAQQRVPSEQGAACPPDVKGEPPTVGSGNSQQPLSDKLAESKGVICPPAGGELKVIPPPGSPGGDRSVEPR